MATTESPDRFSLLDLDVPAAPVADSDDDPAEYERPLDMAPVAIPVEPTAQTSEPAVEAPTTPVDFADIAREASHNASQAPQGMLAVNRIARGEVAPAAIPVPADAPAIVAAITPGTLIANLLRDRNGKIFLIGRSDRRATHRTRNEVRAALASVGRDDLAPKIKTSKAQFGEVMRSLNAPGLRMRSWNVTRRDVQLKGEEWPANLESRWCVGVLDGSDALGSLGEKVLIADLLDTLEIRFTGGNDTMRQKVTEAFDHRVGEETYNATDLLNWFRRMMQETFHTVDMASAIFVPGNADATAPVCGMIAALKPVMSRSIVEIDAVTGEGLLAGLAEGLLSEIEEISDAFDLAQDQARKRDRAKLLKATPNASEADLELAERRAVVQERAATSLLRRLNEKADKVSGYEVMLGRDVIAPVRAMISDLRDRLTPLCSMGAARAAVLEMD